MKEEKARRVETLTVNKSRMERKKKKWYVWKMAHLALALMLITGILGVSMQPVKASTWSNAYTYYNTYENSVVFCPMTDTDGWIYYATKAKKASTNTIYRTLGWKVSIMNLNGSTLQTIYFKLGGGYMNKVHSITKSNYEYNLYQLSLYQLKGRMNSKATTALLTGNADIQIDACMTIVKKGNVKGSMNDNGPVSGQVYSDYSGIASAAGWSKSAKQSLSNYFNKKVEGLFCQVKVIAGDGIKSVIGSGRYCYGTGISVQALPDTGFEFADWSGLIRSSRKNEQFIVTESGSCVASGTPKVLRIYFHRNLTPTDGEIIYDTVRYNKNGAKLDGPIWRINGKLSLGWALDASAKKAKYKAGAEISGKWIDQNAPVVHLFAVWKKEDPPALIPEPPAKEPDRPALVPEPPAKKPDQPALIPEPPAQKPDPTPTPTPPNPTPTPSPQPTEPENGSDPEDKKTTTKRIVRCRFISSQYFEDEHENLIPQERGGLAPDSVWATDTVRRQILRYALRKA